MELKTIRQVSLDYGISRRMLCYYEEIGLIKSTRMDDYAYRTYDEDAIKRIHQIIILRKLQIPMKQIKEILNNPNAAAVIEIFKQNIGELDEQITALSSVKSILVRFVEEIQEKTDIHLKLDLLSDKTMFAVIDALSFSKNRVKEKVSVEELNKASETIGKFTDHKVRIVYFPPMTMVSVGCAKYKPDREQTYMTDNTDLIDDPYEQFSLAMRAKLKKFIDDVDLFRIKPDTRIFGMGNESQDSDGQWFGDYVYWASIPDDLDVPPPLGKIRFDGGLYAACANPSEKTNHGYMINEWLDKTDEYEWGPEGGNRPGMDEYINLFNRHGLKNAYSEEAGFMYLDALVPLKEKAKSSDDGKKSISIALKKLEESVSSGKTVDIDLKTMIKHENDTGFAFEVNYTDRSMSIKADGENHGKMSTSQEFRCPLKIELRAKTDDTNITIRYGNGILCFNWEHIRSSLLVFDIADGSFHCYEKCGEVPINEFADIEWILGRDEMVVMVNGELRHISSDYRYIEAFKESFEYNLSSTVNLSSGYGSTVTVEILRITEM